MIQLFLLITTIVYWLICFLSVRPLSNGDASRLSTNGSKHDKLSHTSELHDRIIVPNELKTYEVDSGINTNQPKGSDVSEGVSNLLHSGEMHDRIIVPGELKGHANDSEKSTNQPHQNETKAVSNLLHTSELHDRIIVPDELQGYAEPQNLLHTSELHDRVIVPGELKNCTDISDPPCKTVDNSDPKQTSAAMLEYESKKISSELEIMERANSGLLNASEMHDPVIAPVFNQNAAEDKESSRKVSKTASFNICDGELGLGTTKEGDYFSYIQICKWSLWNALFLHFSGYEKCHLDIRT